MGGRSVACMNSRDRNLLGFRRDLLTAAAYGVEQFLFVHGDKPTAGGRTSELTVRTMIEEARGTRRTRRSPDGRFGSASRPGCGRPGWKHEADFVFVQVSYSLDALLRWRTASRSTFPSTPG